MTPITENALESLGFEFVDYGDETPYEAWRKDNIEIWNFNNLHWVIDMLDQARVDKEFHFIEELAKFWEGCGLDIYQITRR